MVNPFRRKSVAEIRKSPILRVSEVDSGAVQVGLKPAGNWTRRNPLTEIILPSIFSKRKGVSNEPAWPKLEKHEVGVTWIGHATFLLQVAGRNILVDPIWRNWVKGIKRMRKPGVPLNHLPGIDLVLVTHAHFDHLDRKTLREIACGQTIVVPFDVGNLVHDLGFGVVQELAYWETLEFGPLRITLTPCHHWGARVLHDSHRGFGGFIIEGAGRSVYHCGDTAYFDGFSEIGRRFDIDLALLPIGAYEPPSLRPVHMNPEEAVEAFGLLGAKFMTPMHYGTFRLSYEPMDEPPMRLMEAARLRGVSDRVVTMTEGKPRIF